MQNLRKARAERAERTKFGGRTVFKGHRLLAIKKQPETDEIKEQQKLALKWMERLKVIDQGVVVAGGAPRDWFMGHKANDIDLYVRAQPHSDYALMAQHLTALLGVHVQQKTGVGAQSPSTTNPYDKMESLVAVYEFQDNGQEFDIMFVKPNSDQLDTIRQFDCGICKILWSDEPRIFMHQDALGEYSYDRAFARDLTDQKVTYKWCKEPDNKHVQKLLAKFPHFKHYIKGIRIDNKTTEELSKHEWGAKKPPTKPKTP